MTIAHSHGGTVVIQHWDVGTAERQTAAVEALAAAWERRSWPADLASVTVQSSVDGASVTSWARSTSDDVAGGLVRSNPPDAMDGLAQAVPGIKASEPTAYRFYRATVSGPSPTVGCVVMVRLAADGPALARAWVDAVIDAIESEPAPIPGLIAAHFYVGADGTGIVNYAEWSGEAEHRRAIEGGDIAGIGQTPSQAWDRALALPHITPLALEYYRPDGVSLTRPANDVPARPMWASPRPARRRSGP